MTATREQVHARSPRGSAHADVERLDDVEDRETAHGTDGSWAPPAADVATAIAPVRKAAIVLVSLEQTVASQLLSHLDRAAVEAVTWEIARLECVDPAERVDVLEEFYGLGLRRLCFVFDDLVKMSDSDIRAAFHEEDLETWALAMAGAAAPQRQKVLGALAPLAVDRLRGKLEHLGPFRLSDAEAAQLEIAETFRRLHDRGRVNLPEPTGRDDVVI